MHRSTDGPRTSRALAAAALAAVFAAAHVDPDRSLADHPAASPTAGDAETVSIPGSEVSFQLAYIPGGAFRLGSPPTEQGRNDDEGPQVEVRVKPFWMATHEVTWAEYQEFMALIDAFAEFDERGIRSLADIHHVDAVTAPSKLYEPGFTYSTGDDLEQPAVTMTQYAAKQYTKWLSKVTGCFYRLPSEAEWEYACRAGSTTAYSFGDNPEELSDYGWSYDIDAFETHHVGQKLPNAWGLYDMHGNASEWVLDGYAEDAYARLDSSTTTADALQWPAQLYPRVLRGGSWLLDPVDCRSATRRQSSDDDWKANDPNTPLSPWWFASDEAQDVGFRVVRPVAPPPENEWNKYWDADLPEIQEIVDYRIDEEGRGERGLVDPELPEAVKKLE